MPKYDPSSDKRVVVGVRVVTHTLGAWPNGIMSDNHWSIFLILAGATASVQANMTAEGDDPTGKLIWSDRKYIDSKSSIKFWDYPTVSGVTVKKIHELIYGYKRNYYDMSGGGSGCRWWWDVLYIEPIPVY